LGFNVMKAAAGNSGKPLFEAFLISVYALVLNTAALAAGLFVFLGRDAMAGHMGFGAFLLVLASIAVFSTTLFALRRGPIDTPRRGLRLGLIAAGLFYALILVFFGLIPTVAYLPTGDVRTAAGYLGDVIRITIMGSYGLPVMTGAFGGALYGWLKSPGAAG
jgi:hypothetical protein